MINIPGVCPSCMQRLRKWNPCALDISIHPECYKALEQAYPQSEPGIFLIPIEEPRYRVVEIDPQGSQKPSEWRVEVDSRLIRIVP